MNIAFSTLGCPAWTWDEIFSTAKDLGYNGVEIRGIKKELYAPKIAQFSDENLEKTKKYLNNIGIAIPCLTSAASLSGSDANFAEEVKDYADTASKLGVPYIRVLGDLNANPTVKIDISIVAQNLKKAGEIADSKGVCVLVETNGVFADSDNMLKLLEQSGTKGIGVLWDIHHPHRFFGEELQYTYNKLKIHIKHVHIKDSVMEGDTLKYKLAGEGDVPIKQCLKLLNEDNYSNFVSLEWVKRWYTDLEDAGIVFMQYINYIKGILATL